MRTRARSSRAHTVYRNSEETSVYSPFQEHPTEGKQKLLAGAKQHRRTGEFVRSDLTHTRRRASALQHSILARRVLSALLAAGILTGIAYKIVPALVRLLRDHPNRAITAASIALVLNEYGIAVSERQKKTLVSKLRDLRTTLNDHLLSMRNIHSSLRTHDVLQRWANDNKARLRDKVQEGRQAAAVRTLNHFARRRKLHQWTIYDSTA